MALVPLTTCAQMLGIHPKTLHHWLRKANLPLSAHPTDARIKCVAEEHLLEVAKRHGRPLPVLPAVPKLSGQSVPDGQKEQAASLLASEGDLHHPLTSTSGPSTLEVDLIQKLSCLESKVVTLQEQLAQVALALLQERERTIEHRSSGILHAIAGGKAAAFKSTRARNRARVRLRIASRTPTSSGRTTCPVSHASSD